MKKKVSYTVLQILLAISLMVFGYLLNYSEEAFSPLSLLFVPGAILAINVIMNHIKYKEIWHFPVITSVLCVVGFIIAYFVNPYKITFLSFLLLVVIDLLTVTMGSILYWLNLNKVD